MTKETQVETVQEVEAVEAVEETQPQTVVVNDKAFLMESVTERGAMIIRDIQLADAAIQRHRLDLDLVQAARDTFVSALSQEAEANFELAPEELQPETEETGAE
jgi:hypothetical protein